MKLVDPDFITKNIKARFSNGEIPEVEWRTNTGKIEITIE